MGLNIFQWSMSVNVSVGKMHLHFITSKDDSDYLAFKETTWSNSKSVYCSAFLCKPVPPRSQPTILAMGTNHVNRRAMSHSVVVVTTESHYIGF